VHHEMLDHFAAGVSPIHRLDPAAKTVAALAVILATVLVGRDHFRPLILLAAALVIYQAIARVPVGYTARHLLLLSPLVLGIVGLFPLLEPGRTLWAIPLGPWRIEITQAGLVRGGHLAAKCVLASWAAFLLMATTRFQDLLQALARLRVPRVLVIQLAFMYRYLWILADEVMRLRMARAARDGGGGPWGMRMRSRVDLVGVLFVRTYDRAERVYWAMLARGFDGTMPATATAPARPVDWAFAAMTVAAALLLVMADRCLHG